jgi:hypothetical protein
LRVCWMFQCRKRFRVKCACSIAIKLLVGAGLLERAPTAASVLAGVTTRGILE